MFVLTLFKIFCQQHFTRTTITNEQYANHGQTLRDARTASLQTQLEVFQQLLREFSVTHVKDIRSNPSFRAEFASKISGSFFTAIAIIAHLRSYLLCTFRITM